MSCGRGESVSVPWALPNPWGMLSSVSLLLLLVFFVDATITVWRRGDRRRALVIGGSMIFGAILAWHVPLVIWGILEIPFFLCFAYSGIVAAMGYELSNDMARTAQLARQLQASEADLRETQKRMELAASAAELGMWMWDIERDEIWITDKGRALFGFDSSEKLDFDRFRSRIHPEDRESVLQTVENSLRTGAEYRVWVPGGATGMGKYAGSPGGATSSSTKTVSRFGCAGFTRHYQAQAGRTGGRASVATRWHTSRG